MPENHRGLSSLLNTDTRVHLSGASSQRKLKKVKCAILLLLQEFRRGTHIHFLTSFSALFFRLMEDWAASCVMSIN